MNIIKATKKDRKEATEILIESFFNNPSVNFTVKKGKLKYYKRLANYFFKVAYRKKGIYLTENKKGIIVFYDNQQYPNSWRDSVDKIGLIFGVIGITRIHKILPREKFIQKARKKYPHYIYCWFIGVKEENRGKGEGMALKSYMFNCAKKLQLPILMETTIPLNKKIYERYGFEKYQSWNVPGEDLTYWLMKKEANSYRRQ